MKKLHHGGYLKILDEVVKLRQILRKAGSKRDSSAGGGGTADGFLGYTEALMSLRCLAMGAFWTFDNLNYLTITDTVSFGAVRATRGFSRSWSVSSALYILLGVDALRKTEKKRREALSEYSAAVSQRTGVPNGNGNGNGYPNRSGHGSGSEVPQQQQQQCRGEEGEGEEESRREARLREALVRANAEHFKSWLMVLKGALDLTCAVNVAGMDLPKRLLGRKLNDGVIGAVGCVSALCVLYNSWPARQQQQQQQQRVEDHRRGQQQRPNSLLPPAPAPSPPPPPQQREKEPSRHAAA